MFPYFHASGHYLYAKSAYLYVQDMLKFQNIMPTAEYEKFVKDDFTIKRSDKFRCGIWSDMTIEQTLMKAMHSSGGLTRGRGVTDSVLTKWILYMPTLLDGNLCIFDFCQMSFNTNSEQHVDASNARKSRDSDSEKFYNWLIAHDPFPKNDNIMCISSGFIGDNSINCHNALEKGYLSMKNMVGMNMQNVKFKRKNRVITLKNLSAKKSIDKE